MHGETLKDVISSSLGSGFRFRMGSHQYSLSLWTIFPGPFRQIPEILFQFFSPPASYHTHPICFH